MDNVIYANFSPEFKLHVFRMIKQMGFDRTEKFLLESDINPVFVKAIFKNIMRNMGW